MIMPRVKQYHRPSDIDEALSVLTQKGRSAAILAGGTSLIPELSDEVTDVIDLQSLDLEQVVFSGDRVTLGAMTRLQTVVANDALPSVVRQAARNEGPNTLRNAATVGGTLVAGDSESEFCAAMLAFEALLTVQTVGESYELPLEEFMAAKPRDVLVTGVSFALGGEAAYERVARTPADSPIVAVIGRRAAEGEVVRLAFCGVADRPALLAPSETQELVPPADFRGSSAYRRAVAGVLADRVSRTLA
jgi:CO/xanthine dehydrogenase FAD-binding subunit